MSLGMQDLSGNMLGTYELLEVLGVGGMAVVYRARQTSLGRDVAIKVLAPYLASEVDFAARFRREAATVAHLEHPHIVSIYDYGVESDIVYVVMRLLTGGSLAERMKILRMPSLREASDMLNQIADALDYAHEMGVVHGGVKPGNILLDARGNAYLADFGIAKLIAEAQVSPADAIGTAHYMAPEQATGEPIDRRTDIYSLGALAFNLATGRVPFQGDTTEVVDQHVHEPPPSPRDVNPLLPLEMEAVLLRAMSKSLDKRHQTAGEFAVAFAEAVAAAPPSLNPNEETTFFTVALPRRDQPTLLTVSPSASQPSIASILSWVPARLFTWPMGALALAVVVVVIVAGGLILSFGGFWGNSKPEQTPIVVAASTLTAVALIPTETSTPTAPAGVIYPTSTHTPTQTVVIYPTNTHTAPPTATQTSTATTTPSMTPTPSPSATPSPTPTVTDTPSNTPDAEATLDAMLRDRETQTAAAWTDTPTATSTATQTNTLTSTPTATDTPTLTATSTASPTATRTHTSTATPTATHTNTPRVTSTPTLTDTPTNTPTDTPTVTATSTATLTSTSTATPSSTATSTPGVTSTPTETSTSVPTQTNTPTASPTPTPAPSDILEILRYNVGSARRFECGVFNEVYRFLGENLQRKAAGDLAETPTPTQEEAEALAPEFAIWHEIFEDSNSAMNRIYAEYCRDSDDTMRIDGDLFDDLQYELNDVERRLRELDAPREE